MRELWLLAVCLCCVVFHTESGTVRDFPRRTSLQNALLSYTCKSSNGLLCNGRGQCVRGKCLCNEADVDNTCESLRSEQQVTTGAQERGSRFDTTDSPRGENTPEFMACFGNNEGVCNGHGACVDGTCLCEPQWSGITCEIQNRVGFCETYRSCAECTALFRPCPTKCNVATHFRLVYGFPISGGTFHRCRYRSSERDCSFFFQLDSVGPNGVKNIDVKTCLKYRTTTTTLSETTEHSVISTPYIQEVTSLQTEMTSDRKPSSTTPHSEPPSEEKDDKDFCETHKACAECTALLTRCPLECASKAKFHLVYDFPRTGGSFHRCRSKNREHNCNFYFQLDNTKPSGTKNIMVKTCRRYRSTTVLPAAPKQISVDSITKAPTLTSTPKTAEVTSPTEVMTTDSLHDENETDRNKGRDDGDNSAEGVTASKMFCIVVAFTSVMLFSVRQS